MTSRSIIWQGLQGHGHEAARLLMLDGQQRIEGTAVFTHERQPCSLRYQIICDRAWQTRAVRVDGWVGEQTIAEEIVVDQTGHWWHNGKAAGAVQGCIDIDLNFSPVTNLLPIRRCALAIGEEAVVHAAWLRFPSFTLEALDQVYRRTGAFRYRYASANGSYVADLTVNVDGFVTEYPDLWRVVKGE